jgi:hypothetical protein
MSYFGPYSILIVRLDSSRERVHLRFDDSEEDALADLSQRPSGGRWMGSTVGVMLRRDWSEELLSSRLQTGTNETPKPPVAHLHVNDTHDKGTRSSATTAPTAARADVSGRADSTYCRPNRAMQCHSHLTA